MKTAILILIFSVLSFSSEGNLKKTDYGTKKAAVYRIVCAPTDTNYMLITADGRGTYGQLTGLNEKTLVSRTGTGFLIVDPYRILSEKVQFVTW